MNTNKKLIGLLMVLLITLMGCTQGEQTSAEPPLFDATRILAIGDVMAIVEFEEQMIIGGRDGVFRINQQTFTYESMAPELAMTYVRALLVDQDNALWVGCESGLFRFDGKAWQHFSSQDGSLLDPRVNALYQDSDGRLWVGTWGGVALYDHGQWTHYTRADGLLVDNVNVITESFDGTMWLASYSVRDGGVSYGNIGGWQYFTTAEGLAHCDVTSMVALNQKIYIGAGLYDRGGLSILTYQGSEWLWEQTLANDPLLAGAKVRSLFVDGPYLWVGSEYDGLAVLDLDTWRSLIVTEGLPHLEVKKCYLDQAKNLWIGTRSGVLMLTDTEVQGIYQKINEE